VVVYTVKAVDKIAVDGLIVYLLLFLLLFTIMMMMI